MILSPSYYWSKLALLLLTAASTTSSGGGSKQRVLVAAFQQHHHSSVLSCHVQQQQGVPLVFLGRRSPRPPYTPIDTNDFSSVAFHGTPNPSFSTTALLLSTTARPNDNGTNNNKDEENSDVKGSWEEDHDENDDDDDDETDILTDEATDDEEDDEAGEQDEEEVDDDDDDDEDDRSDDSVNEESTSNNRDDNDDDPLAMEYIAWQKAIRKSQKALNKKQMSLEQEWTKAQQVDQTVARAQLIVNNLYLFNNNNDNTNKGGSDAVDWDKDGEEVELKLDPQYESASAEADALFAQARKQKRGSQVVEELLQEVQQALDVLDDCQQDLSSSTPGDEGRLRLVQDRLRRTAKSTKFQEPRDNDNKDNAKTTKRNNNNNNNATANRKKKKPALGTPASNVRRLLTPNGATVLVGRNRRGNEYLTFTQARGDDIWMHARGCPGAHVLLLARRGSIPPTNDCLAFAAHLAAFYSDGRSEVTVPVTVAEPKHLLKPRGAPLGAVKLRQEGQVLYGAPDLVPQELQEARAQSGVYATEEYRRTDKAKHRKQARQAQDEKDQRRRAQKQKKKRRNSNHNDSEMTYESEFWTIHHSQVEWDG